MRDPQAVRAEGQVFEDVPSVRRQLDGLVRLRRLVHQFHGCLEGIPGGIQNLQPQLRRVLLSEQRDGANRREKEDLAHGKAPRKSPSNISRQFRDYRPAAAGPAATPAADWINEST